LPLLIGVGAGTACGVAANALFSGERFLAIAVEDVAVPIGQIYLRLLLMLVVPLLFSALVNGVAELDVAHLGKIGTKTLGYTVVVSAIAVTIGLVLVNVLAPGAGASEAVRTLAHGAKVPAAAAPPEAGAVAILIAMVPDNPLAAAVKGDMIGLMVFSLIFGVGLGLTKGAGAARLREVIAGLYDTCMTLIDGVLRLAPIGVAALMFTMTARLGFDILATLGFYVAVVIGGLALHMFGIYSLSVRFLGGMAPIDFFRRVRLAMLTAFSTASSAATLPVALEVADRELGLPKRVARFVLTAGSAMNQNGTALFEGVTVIFLAQVYAVPLTLGQQGTIMAICVLAGIGTAGVPSGSIPVIAMMLRMFGIPVESLGMILGVNQLLDMCRTTLNVTGDLAAAVYVAKGEPGDASGGEVAPTAAAASSSS
jgi:DAACS family dicarboxylate/amino acid:cation (Na+ or H+) symporter